MWPAFGEIEPDVVRNMIRCALNGPTDPLYPELTSQKLGPTSQLLLGQILVGQTDVTDLWMLPRPTQRAVKMALSDLVCDSPTLNAPPHRLGTTPTLNDFALVARLTQIPAEFPTGGDSSILRELSAQFGRGPYHALLAYLWIKSGQDKRLLNGAPPPNFTGSTIDPTRNVGGTALLGGLIYAFRAGWITVEADQQQAVLRILPLWGRALMHKHCATELRGLPELIGVNWETTADEDCVALSDEWIDAAIAIATRDIPLPASKQTVHSVRWWKAGYYERLAAEYRSLNIYEAARLWKKATSPVTKYAIELAFSNVIVPDPDNSFRNPIAALTLAIGMPVDTPPPPFEDADAHLRLLTFSA